MLAENSHGLFEDTPSIFQEEWHDRILALPANNQFKNLLTSSPICYHWATMSPKL